MQNIPQFDIYVRSQCHLCEDMLSLLIPYQEQHQIRLNIVDIDGSAALREQYGLKIPVLSYQGEEICHYYFDQAGFLAVLEKL